ncbi:hypothetical protein SDC9_181435 [bioreactor metagenome]|uniref:Uncharacterized protein n=1 Tax=bioreactor metagenome TaxID=1076179 RepID=A0A645HDT8_9ZZZZ
MTLAAVDHGIDADALAQLEALDICANAINGAGKLVTGDAGGLNDLCALINSVICAADAAKFNFDQNLILVIGRDRPLFYIKVFWALKYKCLHHAFFHVQSLTLSIFYGRTGSQRNLFVQSCNNLAGQWHSLAMRDKMKHRIIFNFVCHGDSGSHIFTHSDNAMVA